MRLVYFDDDRQEFHFDFGQVIDAYLFDNIDGYDRALSTLCRWEEFTTDHLRELLPYFSEHV